MPTTGRHNLIQFGDVYLTTTGDAMGKPCKTECTGFDVFEGDGTQGQDIKSLNGSVYQQYQELIDAPVSILSIQMEVDVKDDLQAVIDEYKADPDTPITLILSNGPVEKTFNFKPRAMKPIEYPGTFWNTKLDSVTLHGYATVAS